MLTLQRPAFFYNSVIWSEKCARAVLLFYWKGLSTKEESFSKAYKPEAIFKRLDAFLKLCFQIPLLKGQTLPLTLPSSHPGWHLQPLFCLLKLKLVSQDLYNEAAESVTNNREKSWLDEREVGEKAEQHLKTSNAPLITEPATKATLSPASPGAAPSLPHCHWSPQTLGPPSQLPAVAQPVLGMPFQPVFRLFLCSPPITFLAVLALSQASSTSRPGKIPQTKLLSTQYQSNQIQLNQELREPARSLK